MNFYIAHIKDTDFKSIDLYSSLNNKESKTKLNSIEDLYKIQSIGTAKDHGLYDETDVDQQQGIFEQAKFHLLGKLEDGIPGNEIVYNTVGAGTEGESAGASTFCVFNEFIFNIV